MGSRLDANFIGGIDVLDLTSVATTKDSVVGILGHGERAQKQDGIVPVVVIGVSIDDACMEVLSSEIRDFRDFYQQPVPIEVEGKPLVPATS